MKTITFVIVNVLTFLVMGSCNGQTKNKLGPVVNTERKTGFVDTVNKPKINVSVNKEFDSKGNLTKYDSTYTYVYKGADLHVHDSLFPFRSFFDKSSADLFNQNRSQFLNDPFFDKDFFEKQSELNKKIFDGFWPKMDSLRKCLSK